MKGGQNKEIAAQDSMELLNDNIVEKTNEGEFEELGIKKLLEEEEEVTCILLIFTTKWDLKGDRSKGIKKKEKSLSITYKKRTLFKKKGNMKVLAKEARIRMIEGVECLELGIETMKIS